MESENGNQEILAKFSEELHKLANKFEARIRADFHAQFAETRDLMIRMFPQWDLQQLSNEVFLKLLERFFCLSVVVVGDHRNDPTKLYDILVNWLNKQLTFTKNAVDAAERDRIQRVTESAKINEDTTFVEVQTGDKPRPNLTPTPITKAKQRRKRKNA